jgi:hypothetical protein
MLELTPTRSVKASFWDAKAAAHLLSRAGFGGTLEEARCLALLPVGKAVETLLDEASAAALPSRPRWVRTVDDLRAWWLGEMIRTAVPLREVMTLFWHSHFAAVPSPGDLPQALSQQHDTLRRHAFHLRALRELFGQEATAGSLAGQLIDFFGAVDMQGTLQRRLTAVCAESPDTLAPVLQTLFTAPEFYAPASRGSLIKSPVRLLVGVCRQLRLDVKATPALARLAAAMGQELFNPPPGNGWPGNQSWIGAGTLAVRYHLADALLDGKAAGTFEVGFDPARLFPRNVPADPAALIDGLTERLLLTRVAPATRETLLEACRGIAAVDRPARLIRLILASPEFQVA